MRNELTTKKVIKHTIVALLAYFIAYALTEIIILSVLSGNLSDSISLIFTSFPMMFTGNILPSFIGYGAIYLCNKTINDELLITRSHFFTLLAVLATEIIATIVYYAHNDKFVQSSIAIITWLIIDSVRINKKYKKLKSTSALEENASNVTNIEPQEETVAEQLSLFEGAEATEENDKELAHSTTELPKEENVLSIVTSKRIAAVISIILCITLYLTFLTTVFTTKRDTYICYTTKTGAHYHSATCKLLNTAYETTVYEASRKYKPCESTYCNPCVEQYKTTITDRNYVIPLLISVPASAAVFLLLTYKKKEK